MTPPGGSNRLPPDPSKAAIFIGRTGIGQEVDARAAGEWVDIRFLDAEGVVRGFSLNTLYAGKLAIALVAEVVKCGATIR